MIYLYGFFSTFVLIMTDSTSENVSCVSVSMFINFLTEDGHLFNGLSEMFS